MGIFLLICPLFVSFADDLRLNDTPPYFDDTGTTLYVGEQRVLVIGDVHGDYFALLHILQSEGLVDHAGNWSGGNQVLISLGDLVDRGDKSIAVMDLMMRLETQALRQGGKVISLLGNHEQLLSEGDLKDFSLADRRILSPSNPRPHAVIRHFRSEDSPYAQWFRQRPTVIRIVPRSGRRHLLVHAGVDRYLDRYELEEINPLVSRWMTYTQENGSELPKKYGSDLMNLRGPLWTTQMALSAVYPRKVNPLPRDWLESSLDQIEVDGVISGHTFTHYLHRDIRKSSARNSENSRLPEKEESPILRQTPFYGRRVILADTGISFEMEGRLSSLSIQNGQLTPRYYRRPSKNVCARALELIR